MPDDALRLIDVAGAVSDGAEIDWEAAESATADEAERAILRDLRVLARVGALHRSDVSGPAAESTDVDGPGSHADRRAAAPAWGPLRLLERIGDGRFGEVYRAWDPRLDREVALKLLRGERAVPAPAVIREARLLARVRHPNVVTVHGADVIDGRVGLWMEFIRGETLADAVRVRGPFGARDAMAIGVDLCRALAAVHEAGLVHRDLKPQNVMREPGGRIVLMDFGAGAEESSHRATHGVAGTPLYLATELFEGGPATVRSDIYSLGVLLYFLVSGTHPVTGGTADDLRAQHALGARARLREARPELPAAFAEAVDRALEPDPSRRFESASAFETALACSLEREPVTPEVPRRTWRRRTMPYAAVIASLVVTAALASRPLGVWPLGQTPPSTASQLAERESVLLAAFENRTGEAALDGAIEAALERELANSRFLNVVPRVRVEDTLRLMGRAPDTRVDASVAREIAARDRGIRAILAGRVDKIAGVYVLSTVVRDPIRDIAVASVSENASTAAGLLRALRRLSNGVREALGEARQRVREDDRKLEKVTTPSLEALRLYTESYRLGDRGQWRAALDLVERAVEADPEFASAQIWRAWALRNTNAPTDEVYAAAERALSLAARTTEEERYWIVGSYHSLRGDDARAVGAYEMLVRLNPDHLWAVDNLAYAYRRLGRGDLIENIATRRAAIQPTSVVVNHTLAVNLASSGKFDAARRYFSRVVELTNSPAVDSSYAWYGASARLAPAYETWSRDDPEATLRALDRLANNEAAVPRFIRETLRTQLISYYLALGRLSAARSVAARLEDQEQRHGSLALAAFAADDVALLQRELYGARDRARSPTGAGTWPITHFYLDVWLRARAGLAEDADSLLEHAVEQLKGAGLDYLRGEIALSRGEVDRAILLLRPDVLKPPPSFSGSGPYCRAAESLAAAHERRGELEEAANVLRDAAEKLQNTHPGRLMNDYFWMRLRVQLAELDRRLGREAEARALEERLARLLAVADPDFPLAVRLRRLREAAASTIRR